MSAAEREPAVRAAEDRSRSGATEQSGQEVSLKPDREEAEAFLRALTGEAEPVVTFQTFDDAKKKRGRLARVHHGTLAQHRDELVRLNREGAGIFVMVNEGDGVVRDGQKTCRTAKNVIALRALFVDDDSGALRMDDLPLHPSIVVQSKQGPHAYWRLRPGESLDRFTPAQEAMAKRFGTDTKVKDLPHVMRLPGFFHMKDPAHPFLVRVPAPSLVPSRIHTIDEVLQGIRATAMTGGALPGTGSRPYGFAPEAAGADPIERARAYIAKMGPAIEGSGGDHHTFRVAAALVKDYALSDDEAWPLLREWNATCQPPWSEEDLRAKIASARKSGTHWEGAKINVEPSATAGTRSAKRHYHNTELGNAERLADQHGNHLRYARGRGWLAWDGQRWARDETDEVMRLAVKTVRAMFQEADRLEGDARTHLLKHAMGSEKRASLKAMVDLAQSQNGMAVAATDLDRDPNLLNVENGTIDLRTGALRAHGCEDLITKICPVAYDPAATAPTWEQFIRWVCCDRLDLVEFMQRALGYCLTGHAREQVWFFLHGGGDNGKTTMIEAVEGILGDYAMRAMPDVFTGGTSHPTELAAMAGSRLVIAIEPETGKAFRDGLMKMVTGEKTMAARFVHKDQFQFPITFKIVVAANHRPPTRDTSDGFWRRVRLVPFENRISEKEKDRTLGEKLRAEASGILAWLVRGSVAWYSRGLGKAPEVDAATRGYREEQDFVRRFIEEECVARPDAWVKTAALFELYVDWARRNGDRAVQRTEFVTQLERLDGVRRNRRNIGDGLLGIEIRSR